MRERAGHAWRTITGVEARPHIAVLLICILFICFSSLWLSQLGVQTDEALFAGAIYPPFSGDMSLKVFHHSIPLMVMSYVGATKGWLYQIVFLLVPPSPATIRLPSIVIGALTIWFTYRLTSIAVGSFGGVVAAALLSTDAMFLLTTRWDWGPVAIQHLCLVGSVLSVVTYVREKQLWYLGAGFFLFGLGIWDKALFAWSLAGLAVATLAVYWRTVVRHLRPKPIAVSVICFCLGAAPLLVYNIRHHWITFRSNTAWSADNIHGKARLFKETMQGAGLYGVIAREPWDKPPVPKVHSASEKFLLRVNVLAGSPARSLQWYALLASLAAFPFMLRAHRRAAGFAIVFMAVTWGMMAFTKDAGGSTHHTILLWPAPQVLIACGLVTLQRRKPGAWVAGVMAAAVCISNVLVVTTYYAHQITSDGTPAWSDAVYGLSDALRKSGAEQVCVLDWGFFDSLRVLHQGTLKLCVPSVPASAEERVVLARRFADSKTVFVTHVKGIEFYPEDGSRFTAAMTEAGFVKHKAQIITDSGGRPTIELFYLRPLSAHRDAL